MGSLFFMCGFEEKVRKNLIQCGINPDGGGAKIGVAVSGGADSLSLLVALSELFSSLYVITVNHNIRPAAESGGDAEYVLHVCERLRRTPGCGGGRDTLCRGGSGREIVCEVVELEPGAVDAEMKKRGRGLEEAARYLRYEAFEKFIAAHNLDALCLAHNQNDQIETLLMRFLQGASSDSAGGIKACREKFVRPLLNISRAEIEEYLTGREISWRTDKTNYETDYLRNKIRLKLVPFLDEEFPGWQKAVLSGGEKSLEDAAFIKSCVEAFPFSEEGGKIGLPLADFMQAPESLKYRILLEACNRVGENSRIPHQFLKDVIKGIKCGAGSQSLAGPKHFCSIDIICEKNYLFVKKHEECNTDLVFSDIIEKTGNFEFPFGTLHVLNYREEAGKKYVSVSAGDGGRADDVQLPFLVRNIGPGDTLLCADGSEKKALDILSDWHLDSSKRNLVPVIQLLDDKNQRIKALFAAFLGYKDWIVKL